MKSTSLRVVGSSLKAKRHFEHKHPIWIFRAGITVQSTGHLASKHSASGSQIIFGMIAQPPIGRTQKELRAMGKQHKPLFTFSQPSRLSARTYVQLSHPSLSP